MHRFFLFYLGELFESDRYLNGEKFDFIILSHVMEHISDVKRAALILRELLSDDGQLYIETPDAGQYARHYIVPYYYFDSEHINHFDRNSLFNLFESAGFNTVQIMSKSFLVNETTRYPAIFGIFKKIANPQPYIFLKDDAARKEIEQYINMSNDTVSNQVLEQLAGSGQPIVVFGAGNFTARLLESTPLKKCNIYAFVDNDVKKHGNTFNNTLIREPAFLKQFKGPVVVCSALFFNQILNQLKNDLQIPNEIITIR